MMKVEMMEMSLTEAVGHQGDAAGNIDNKETESLENGASENEFKIKYSREELERALYNFQESVDIFNKRFHFRVHDETNRVQVQIIDCETDEVIKEIPPEKILDLLAAFQQLAGILIDLQA